MDAEYFISKLKMQPHVEGGYYKETYRHPHTITSDNYKFKFENQRSLSTVIYFLLNSGERSKFHKLKFDEMWFYHSGCPLTIHMIDENGKYSFSKLGLDLDKGEVPQFLVPANVIFGSEPSEKNSFTLVSCMVSPGFDFRDFQMFESAELINKYPLHADIITHLNGVVL